jgi:peptide-methionine (R)-S-oxide reductase
MDSLRRRLLEAAAVAVAVPAWPARAAAAAEPFEVSHTDAEWLKLLGPRRFEVLRRAATEPAFTSPLNHEHRDGMFRCAGCELELFTSEAKFDSRTGWPSFRQALDGAIGTTRDSSFGMIRTAVHCRRCGGHLGHVFDDGPKPTGLRYCMNGLALTFVAA